MKYWKYILGLLLFISYSCGTQNPGGKFSRDGVNFTYAAGWSITEQEDLDGAGYYLSVEKSGLDASGLLTLTWIDVSFDPGEYIQLIQEELENQPLVNNLSFQQEVDRDFNGIPALSCDFTFKTLGLKHKGRIYVFVKNEKTYSIIKQEALEDHVVNLEGFEVLETTFQVK